MDRSQTSAGVLATLAGLSAATGLVHLAVVPAHVAEWPAEGRSFALLAVAQLALAVLLVARPSREALSLAVPVHGAAVAGWAWSRTSGFPFGPTPDVAEEVGWLDGATTAAEILAVLLAGVLLVVGRRLVVPSGDGVVRLTRPIRVGPPPAWGIGLAAVLVVGSIGLAASPAGQHGHDEGAGHSHGGGARGAGHTHTEEAVIPPTPLDEATRVALAAQLSRVRELALEHPTVADAEADGYLRAGPFAPGAGAHYVNQSFGQDQGFDVERPLSYLYAGTDPDSPIVGVMYFTLTDTPPEGFAGPLDTWHEHSGVCLQARPDGSLDVPLPPDTDVTEADCAEVGGDFLGITGQMVHAWVVPGWDSPLGVFSHDNPLVTCADGRQDLGEDLFRGCAGI